MNKQVYKELEEAVKSNRMPVLVSPPKYSRRDGYKYKVKFKNIRFPDAHDYLGVITFIGPDLMTWHVAPKCCFRKEELLIATRYDNEANYQWKRRSLLFIREKNKVTCVSLNTSDADTDDVLNLPTTKDMLSAKYYCAQSIATATLKFNREPHTLWTDRPFHAIRRMREFINYEFSATWVNNIYVVGSPLFTTIYLVYANGQWVRNPDSYHPRLDKVVDQIILGSSFSRRSTIWDEYLCDVLSGKQLDAKALAAALDLMEL